MERLPKHEAYDYAERLRARLPRTLQEKREAAGLSKYALEQRSGITREMIGRVELGKANPSLCLTAQLTHAMGLTLTEFLRKLDSDGGS
jgi:transcriptional regulator with XRE-family HTH domain